MGKAAAKTTPARESNPRTGKAGRKANRGASSGKSTVDGLSASAVTVLCTIIRGGTQLEAAREAGMTVGGVKYLMSSDAFKAALERNHRALQAIAVVDANGLVDELLPSLRTDIRKFFQEDGRIKPVSEWDEDMGRSVASIENEEIFEGQGEDRTYIGNVVKLKFWNKIDAADKIAKILGLYAAEKKDHSGVIGVVVVPAKSVAPEQDVPASRPPIDGEVVRVPAKKINPRLLA